MQVKLDVRKKRGTFNLTIVDHLYVNHLFVMVLLPFFEFVFFASFIVLFVSSFNVGVVVFRIGCQFCSLHRNKRHRTRKKNARTLSQSASKSKPDKNNAICVFVLKTDA